MRDCGPPQRLHRLIAGPVKMSVINSILHASASKSRSSLGRTRESAARSFLFRHGFNSSSFVLPEFYVASGFTEMQLEPVEWTGNVRNLRVSRPLELVAPKGQVGWRRFSILHPYAFWHIVRCLTEQNAWAETSTLLSRPSLVASYTIPQFRLTAKTPQGMNISYWLKFAESDLIADSPTFSHLGMSDIQNFYPSIYTHSLAWAFNGRETIKANRRDWSLLGNRIDKLFQSARDGQTNGIPIGSMVSDVVSEVVLNDVDRKLSDLVDEAGTSAIMARFRDDYRILAKNYHDAREILTKLARVLHDCYDLTLNSSKTRIADDVVGAAFRPWTRAAGRSHAIKAILEGSGPITGRDLKEALLDIHELQRSFSEGRIAVTLLQKVSASLEDGGRVLAIGRSELQSCTAVLRVLMRIREEVAPYVMILADKIFSTFSDSVSRPMIEAMISEERAIPNNDFLEIWLYRLALHRFPQLARRLLDETSNPLLKMARMERPHVHEFPGVERLSKGDLNELEKFSFINSRDLEETEEVPLTSKIVNPWRRPY